MNWTRTFGQEVLGLFVDDGRLALAALVWLGIVWQGLPQVGLHGIAQCLVLFAGVAVILAENCLRRTWFHKHMQ
jgi:hypothetical protein